MGERTELLKSRMEYKDTTVKNFVPVGSKEENIAVIESERGLGVCLERARLITESYRATEGEPEVIRRAKALSHILGNMTVYIEDGELIVGNLASGPHKIQLYPELSVRWLDDAFNDGYKGMLDEKGREEWSEISKYWKTRATSERLRAIVPEYLKDFIQWNPMGWAHNFEAEKPSEILDINKVFRSGLKGIAEQIKGRLEEIELKFREGTLPGMEYLGQKNNLEAMLISLHAAINFGGRFAVKARELISTTGSEKRKEELRRIAEVCERVPANPPRTLHEALQSFYFCSIISKQIETCGQMWGNRFDVIMDPYYQKDKEGGNITREEAQELVECLYIKSAEWGFLRPPGARLTGQGMSVVKDLTIGGVTPEGDDATNEFSFIALDAAQSVHLPEPTIALRYHPKISPKLVFKAMDVLRTGVGYPAFYNDAAIITWLVKMGVPLEEARDYGIPSCVLPMTPGRNISPWEPNCGHINLGKCMELVLYQGMDKDKYTGRQLGVKTPDPQTFTCIEEVMDAVMCQVGFVAEKLAAINKIYQVIHEQYLQRPFSSTQIRGCIEKGQDCTAFHDGWVRTFTAGTTNAANSLAAIQKFVFDEKAATMREIVEACRTNFEGREEFRQRLLNEAPKYGNDDDYADRFAREIHTRTEAELEKLRNNFGRPFTLDGSIAGGYFGVSMGCGALPDGKRDSESFADAVISPSAGTDKKGPTAVLKSAGKIPPSTYPTLLNQKFMPHYLEGENKKIFASYLKGWYDLGIWHIQFNVINREMLLDAQAHPERYTDLIVRVAGYSAYFVDLPLGLQEDIIKRTEQEP